jgi:hypothetical protein
MTVRYAFRVRGSSADASRAAQEAGLQVESVSVTTTISGRFRDQAALFGSLVRLRLFGLEVMDVRRLPRSANGSFPGHSVLDDAFPSSPE